MKNPYRYRGYRYDAETGLYYLQSRYYNSDWGRFINSDGIIGQKGDLLGHNLFIYCKNNPIIMSDSDGFRPAVGIGSRETPEELEASLACMSEVNWNRYINKQNARKPDTYSAYGSAKKANSSSQIDKFGETVSGALIKGKKVWKDFGRLGLGKYVDEFSSIANIGRKTLGYAGTIGWTAWDVGKDIGKGEYFSAGVALVSAGVGVGVGIFIGSIGAPALAVLGLGILFSATSDMITTGLKNNYYRRKYE